MFRNMTSCNLVKFMDLQEEFSGAGCSWQASVIFRYTEKINFFLRWKKQFPPKRHGPVYTDYMKSHPEGSDFSQLSSRQFYISLDHVSSILARGSKKLKTKQNEILIWWGKFSPKHNYTYMTKRRCILAMDKLHVSAYSGHFQVWQLSC